ncbi:MAG TPA: hypothetical protein VFZ70_09675 [Euzebyales bacterium]
MSDDPTAWYLVATDDGSDMTYTVTREAGVERAAKADAGVILYDRTSESKLTNPYPSGPWSDEGDAVSPDSELEPETLREMGRAYLADQVVEIRDRGMPARAHLAVNTGAQALTDAVRRYRPTTIVFPRKATDEGGMLAKLTDGSIAEALSDTSAEVVLIDEDGNQVS